MKLWRLDNKKIGFCCYFHRVRWHVAGPCDLDLWPIALNRVSFIAPLLPDTLTNFDFPTNYLLLSYELLNLIIYQLSDTVIAHAPCHAKHHLCAK